MKALPASLLDALTSTAATTGEYRALPLYDVAPHGCGAVLVPDDRFAPHLQAGELAVVDPEDNEPIAGEIYLITVASPLEPDGVKLKLVQLWTQRLRFGSHTADGQVVPDHEDSTGWWMRFGLKRPAVLRAFHTMEAAAAAPSSMALSDGPMREEGVRQKIVGRVVGIVLAKSCSDT